MLNRDIRARGYRKRHPDPNKELLKKILIIIGIIIAIPIVLFALMTPTFWICFFTSLFMSSFTYLLKK